MNNHTSSVVCRGELVQRSRESPESAIRPLSAIATLASQQSATDIANLSQVAREWVNGYAIGGAAVVAVAIVPGATAVALCGIEATMCRHIGTLFRGPRYTWEEALAASAAVGLTCILSKIAALEAMTLLPWAWPAKPAVAAGAIKLLGEAIIAYYSDAARNS